MRPRVRGESAHGNNVGVPDTREPLRIALLDSIPQWGGGQNWDVQTARGLTGRGHFVAIACARAARSKRARAPRACPSGARRSAASAGAAAAPSRSPASCATSASRS